MTDPWTGPDRRGGPTLGQRLFLGGIFVLAVALSIGVLVVGTRQPGSESLATATGPEQPIAAVEPVPTTPPPTFPAPLATGTEPPSTEPTTTAAPTTVPTTAATTAPTTSTTRKPTTTTERATTTS